LGGCWTKYTYLIMKFNIFKFFAFSVIALGALTLSSCSKDKDEPTPEPTTPPAQNSYLTVSTASVSFESNGGTQTLQISSNTNWTIKNSDTWVTVSPASGFGNASIALTASGNTSSQRSCQLTIITNDNIASQAVQITQTPSPLADQVSGTYSGRLKLGEDILEDAYIVSISKLTNTTVAVSAGFLGNQAMNFNLTESGNQIQFSNATLSNFSMFATGNSITINYLSAGGNMLTYTGSK